MKIMKAVAFAFSFLCVQASIASAEELSTTGPKTTATRPAREHPEETALPNDAPPATRTQTTESTSQNPATKQINEEAKKKLEIEGK